MKSVNDISEIRALAMDLPEVEEQPHFHKTSFRVRKKIFATLEIETLELVLKFNEIDQSVFVNGETIYPVKGKWGKKGWTAFQADGISKDLLEDALKVAYRTVAPKRLSSLINLPPEN